MSAPIDDLTLRVGRDLSIWLEGHRQGADVGRLELPLSVVQAAVNTLEGGAADLTLLQTLGGTLFEGLFPSALRAQLRSSRDEARRRQGRVRVRLVFEDAALAALPWECLYDASTRSWLATDPAVALMRRPVTHDTCLQQRHERFDLLIAWANPSGTQELSWEEEVGAIQESLREHVEAGRVHVEVLENATPIALERRLQSRPWHGLHFIGHGGAASQRREGHLVLDDGAGSPAYLGASALRQLLRWSDRMRLVFLNACETSRERHAQKGGDLGPVLDPPPAGGTAFREWLAARQARDLAGQLAEMGLPAVVGMQHRVQDASAAHFSASFYTALADRLPVELAVQRARSSLGLQLEQQRPGSIAFASPVLHLVTPRGDAFHLLPAQSETP